MDVSNSIRVLGAISIWITGLKVIRSNYAGCYSLCSLVASFIYSSKDFAMRTPLQVKAVPHCSERQSMNILGWSRRNVLVLA